MSYFSANSYEECLVDEWMNEEDEWYQFSAELVVELSSGNSRADAANLESWQRRGEEGAGGKGALNISAPDPWIVPLEHMGTWRELAIWSNQKKKTVESY